MSLFDFKDLLLKLLFFSFIKFEAHFHNSKHIPLLHNIVLIYAITYFFLISVANLRNQTVISAKIVVLFSIFILNLRHISIIVYRSLFFKL